MNQSSLIRKVIYIALIAALLYPLFVLGQPASVDKDGVRNPGGVLSQLRDQHNLSQANLGEIDPASESMKLATLGMRGVAANVLWSKANYYKKTENWDALSATLNQITKLQPNFVSVWEFQSHNLAYNVSVEFDDYRLRYHWVKKGIDFLIQGTRHNTREPRLLHYVGWITGQKIGRADEHVQFRQLFGDDKDYHASLQGFIDVRNNAQVRGPEGKPDNWLVGRLWYIRAEHLVDEQGVVLKGKSPLVFHSDSPMSLINYAGAIEKEGYFSDVARNAWRNADAGWREYGDRPLPSSWGVNIRLNNIDDIRARSASMTKELDELAPGVRKRLTDERCATLTPIEKRALETSQAEWRENLYDALYSAEQKVAVRHREIADLAPPENQRKAKRIADQLFANDIMAARTIQYREIVNYGYWRTRCEVEQTKQATDARQLIYEADAALKETELIVARKKYDEAWAMWADIMEEHSQLRNDVTADELRDQIKRYQLLLQQMDEDFPDDFPLAWLMEEGGRPTAAPPEMPGLRQRITPTPSGKEKPADAAAEPPVTPEKPPVSATPPVEPPPAP